MWSDFQIGDRVQACTAVNIIGYNLSHNDVEYWWNSSEYDIGGKIHKSSDVGQTLNRMIADRTFPDEVEEFILQAALTVMTPNAVARVLENVKTKAFAAGRRDKEAEFRCCLGLGM